MHALAFALRSFFLCALISTRSFRSSSQAMFDEFESQMSAVLEAVAALTASVDGASGRLREVEVECREIDRLLGTNPPGDNNDDKGDDDEIPIAV
jgi:hypothetical protein